MRQMVCRVLGSLAVCAAMTVTGAGEAQWLRYPAISPDGETVVFSHRGDLWRVPSAGGTATPLTLHAAHDTAPVWSRDGSWIAFASDRYGNFDVWVVSAKGGEATRLTFHSADDRPTSFSPDGKEILFSSSRLDAASCVQFPTGAQPELYAVLHLLGRTARFLQTATALLGTGALLGVVAVVLMTLVPTGEQTDQSAFAAVLFLGLIVWSVLVTGHILRHAFDIRLAQGAAIAVIYNLLSYTLVSGLASGS